MTVTEPGRRDTRAYVTVLSTDGYLLGVLALEWSLRRCRSQYPFYVVVGTKVGVGARTALHRAGIRTIDGPPLDVPPAIISANLASDYHRHWAGVFEKLLVFSLDRFDKIVYLDSDMLVIRNIDELFEQPHMAAVIADVGPRNPDHRILNAGLMVIEPRPALTGELLATVSTVYDDEMRWRVAAGRPVSMGVQSVINDFWPQWQADERLHLHPKYNVLVNQLDYYLRHRGYQWSGRDGVRILHFIGEWKPWMGPPRAFATRLARLLTRRRFWEFAANLAGALVYGIVAGRQLIPGRRVRRSH